MAACLGAAIQTFTPSPSIPGLHPMLVVHCIISMVLGKEPSGSEPRPIIHPSRAGMIIYQATQVRWAHVCQIRVSTFKGLIASLV